MAQVRNEPVLIVGIGASAGGLEALEVLFRGMPVDTRAAFVVVTHLSPRRESALGSILQRYTEIPVVVADEGVVVEAGRIYAMPESGSLTIEDGRLHLKRNPTAKREIQPIDLFLSSLAFDQGENAAAIILSGADGDGTLGVKAIKENGGLTMAQAGDGHSPRYPGMPQTAIASGMIDFAIPVLDMPRRLAAYLAGFAPADPSGREDRDGELERIGELRGEICSLLQGQLGHDFSGYKTRTFNRRVQRRIQLLQLDGIEAYVALLRQDTSEVAALFRDLLINVTNFFRDAEAFAALAETVVPALFKGKGPDDTVRVWVPGCATGEEVYSIAILLREHIDAIDEPPRVQIFATDIDERALEVARAAHYPEPLLKTVSAERRRRFFRAEGSSFVVTQDVRELCIFSPHSLIRDPPFSGMDLVSCRNLLIYLAPDLQAQVIPLFHYSLRLDGFLFLGTSENVGQFPDLFAPVDKKMRIFKTRESSSPSLRLPMLSRTSSTRLLKEVGAGARLSSMQKLRQGVDAQVLERFSPAHVIIDSEGDILLYSARTGKYLEAAPGMPSRQLLAMARKSLRLELRSAVRLGISERRRVERHGISLELDDGRLQTISIVVEPLDIETTTPMFIVLFFDVGPPVERDQTVHSGSGDQSSAMSALERELVEARERLQSMIEEYETALEELKSSNEELVSVNEELQSTNEELEASKEELQSLNEELQTVNMELGLKIEELDQSNGELRNLFDTSKMATIFVHRDLSIRNFTPLAAELFSLLPSDKGRLLAIFTSPLDYPEFVTDISRVVDGGDAIERHVSDERQTKRYMVRIQPFHSPAGRRDGATVTFLDITGLSAGNGD